MYHAALLHGPFGLPQRYCSATKGGLLFLGLVLVASLSGFALINGDYYGLYSLLPTAVVISRHC